MFICQSVGRGNRNPNPIINLDEILHPSTEGFGTVSTLFTFLPCAEGARNLKAEGNIFEKCLQNKRCSAGCKDSYGKFGPLPNPASPTLPPPYS